MWTYNYNYGLELYHHGILGQKWGQRNGPPYPLSYGSHSVRERLRLGKYGITRPKKEKVLSKETPKPETSNHAKSGASGKPASKSVKDMTYEELQQEVNRLALEKRYNDLMREYNSGNNQKKKHRVLRSIGRVVAKPLTEVTQEALKIGIKRATNSVARSMGYKDFFSFDKKKQ